MISSQDRSGWFGASDTHFITGNWNTKTFISWWLVKRGLTENNFTNKYLSAGTFYEHKILDFIGVKDRDRQIKKRFLRLRVNLDGETKDCIHEVKTHKSEIFKLTRAYWEQCQVEMYASKKRKCVLVAYRLIDEDYINFFNPIDKDRLSFHPIEYDESWIKNEYLPKLKTLRKHLKNKTFPR